MTLRDELVKLFRADTNLSEEVIQHLADLAVERAEQVIEGVKLSGISSYALDESPVVETQGLPGPWKRALIAALGKVKRGS